MIPPSENSIIPVSSFNGLNNRANKDSLAFQVGESGIFLSKAEGVFFTDLGEAAAFPAPSAISTSPTATLFSCPLGVFSQQGQDLVFNPQGNHITLFSGLIDKARFVYHQGLVYWTDGLNAGRVNSDLINKPWFVEYANAPSVTATTGSLPEGAYLISVTFLDEDGREGACGPSAFLTLATGGVEVSINSNSSTTKEARVWITLPNGSVPMLVDQVALDEFPYTVTDLPTADIPLRTQNKDNLPVDRILASYRGYLFSAVGNYIWYSLGPVSHLTDIEKNLFVFPETIVGMAETSGGLFVATEGGLYFIGKLHNSSSPDLDSAVVEKKNSLKYAKNGVSVSGLMFPKLQSPDKIAVFVSEAGLVIGTGDGNVALPQQQILELDVEGKEAAFAFFSEQGTPLLAFLLES